MTASIWEMTPQFVAAVITDLIANGGSDMLEAKVTASLDGIARAELFTGPGVGRVTITRGKDARTYQFVLTETTDRGGTL